MHPTAFYSGDGHLGGQLFLVNLIPLQVSPDISGVLPRVWPPPANLINCYYH
jgi:hypothetical protein